MYGFVINSQREDNMNNLLFNQTYQLFGLVGLVIISGYGVYKMKHDAKEVHDGR